jgi:hypothetical protein
MPQVLGLTGAGLGPRVLAFPDKPKEGVRRGVNEVDSVVGAVGQVVFLGRVVDPANIEAVGPVVGRRALGQRDLACLGERESTPYRRG